MKNIQSLIRMSLVVVVVTLMIFGINLTMVQAADGVYSIQFKAGESGTVDGGESTSLDVAYGDEVMAGAVTVTPADGYYWTGWSPEVETTVTKKATYVAQYARIINEAVYRVNYVDTFGNALATQKVAKSNAGVGITEYALPIDGYAVNVPSITANVAATGTEFTFTYTTTEQAQTISNVTTVTIPGGTTVVTTNDGTTGVTTTGAAGNAADGNAVAGAAGAAGTAIGTANAINADGTPGATTVTGADGAADGTANGTVNNPGNTTTQQGTTIADEQTPLANQDLDQNNKQGGFPWMAVGIGALVIALAAGIVILTAKRRRSN